MTKKNDKGGKKSKKVNVKDLDTKKDPKGGPIYMKP
jgi:hypothetical protein